MGVRVHPTYGEQLMEYTNNEYAFNTFKAEIIGWLETKQTTLWADWIITDPDGLENAAEWFGRQMQEFTAHRLTPRHAPSDGVSAGWDVIV